MYLFIDLSIYLKLYLYLSILYIYVYINACASAADELPSQGPFCVYRAAGFAISSRFAQPGARFRTRVAEPSRAKPSAVMICLGRPIVKDVGRARPARSMFCVLVTCVWGSDHLSPVALPSLSFYDARSASARESMGGGEGRRAGFMPGLLRLLDVCLWWCLVCLFSSASAARVDG